MNVLLPFKIQKEVPETSTRTLLSRRVPGTRFAHPSGSLNQPPPLRILEKLVLNSGKNLVGGCRRKLPQSLRERARFDEYHIVVYTTM